MSAPIPLFVELCAGLASVSGVLEHGSTWKPPVSRMGRKTGYASAILRVMGLRPRQRAERYLWAEADGDVAALRGKTVLCWGTTQDGSPRHPSRLGNDVALVPWGRG